MSDDLVSRLRDAHANATQRILGSSIFGDAATALTEARAEIERLAKHLDLLAVGFSVPDGGRYLADWQTRISKFKAAEAEIERLRKVACDCATAIGNGAALSPESSLDFIELLPGEIAKHTDKLRRFLKCARDEGTEALDRAAAAESELSTLRARVREVVGPFADAAADLDDTDKNSADIWEAPCAMQINVGHLRAARQLMEEVK